MRSISINTKDTSSARYQRVLFLKNPKTRKELDRMDYGMIGKIDKAKRYAQEPGRFHFSSFDVTMDGENNRHTIHYENGVWSCDCDFFRSRGRCSHTMALEMILEKMVASEVVQP
jgi:hypothetical protein